MPPAGRGPPTAPAMLGGDGRRALGRAGRRPARPGRPASPPQSSSGRPPARSPPRPSRPPVRRLPASAATRLRRGRPAGLPGRAAGDPGRACRPHRGRRGSGWSRPEAPTSGPAAGRALLAMAAAALALLAVLALLAGLESRADGDPTARRGAPPPGHPPPRRPRSRSRRCPRCRPRRCPGSRVPAPSRPCRYRWTTAAGPRGWPSRRSSSSGARSAPRWPTPAVSVTRRSDGTALAHVRLADLELPGHRAAPGPGGGRLRAGPGRVRRPPLPRPGRRRSRTADCG